MAITDTTFTYSTVQTGYLMIGPGDLVPSGNTSANDYILETYVVDSGAGACFIAPVHLPQGARITSVRTSYLSGADSVPTTSLYRTNPVTLNGATLFYSSILDDSGTIAYVNDVVPANLGLVSNSLYTYTYRLCVGSVEFYYGARITYSYSSAGD